MEQQGGGDIAAKRSSGAAAAGEDRLSALPNDVLVLILLHLNTPEAARTSVLARRWRRVWELLPELRFAFIPDSHGLRDALASSAVPLRYLLVEGLCSAAAKSLATWLPAAARRLFGEFVLVDKDPGRGGDSNEEEATDTGRGALELPCFEEATSISLDLGFLGLAVPPAGVFARLTELSLIGVRFNGVSCELGEAVSLPRCPCLQKLTIKDARGLENLGIHSDSLKLVLLKLVRGLEQLAIVASLLEELSVVCCFYERTQHPVVNISASQLKVLKWADSYDPRSMHLGKMEHLQKLITIFLVYGPESFAQNRMSLMLMSYFKVVKHLSLALFYIPVSSLLILFGNVIVYYF
ncbi:unnamed protein product [Urochloa humidicola]